MSLASNRVQAILAPRPVRFLESVDSTNNIAIEWLRAGAHTGSVVIADEQRQGRGRKGRTWYMPPGVALAVSVILRPPAELLSQVSMLGGVVITELCDHVGVQGAGIKWPNDVQVNGLKVSGVLPEAVWGGNRLLGVALGMGINVRIDFRGTELEDSAISLETALGKSLDRLDLLVYLLERIDHWAARMETGTLFDVWKQRLNMIGKRVTVTDDSGVVQGIAETVEVQGTLLIRAKDGSLHRVLAGDLMMGTGA